MDIEKLKKRVIKFFIYLFLIIFFSIILLLIIRLLSARELDDVSPGISCDDELLEKSDILFIIPKYRGVPISDNPEWCNKILSLNKKLAMHGVVHTYAEFESDKNRQYFDEGVKIFIKCFNQTPEEFKPPQLMISKNNIKMISSEMKVDTLFSNDLYHKIYHCEDTGKTSNKFNDWF